MSVKFTAWNVSVFGVFWSVFSRNRTEYREIRSIQIFSPNSGKYIPEEFRIRTLFTQWLLALSSELNGHYNISDWSSTSPTQLTIAAVLIQGHLYSLPVSLSLNWLFMTGERWSDISRTKLQRRIFSIVADEVWKSDFENNLENVKLILIRNKSTCMDLPLLEIITVSLCYTNNISTCKKIFMFISM